LLLLLAPLLLLASRHRASLKRVFYAPKLARYVYVQLNLLDESLNSRA
jgi:hypothetical protein